MEGAFSEDARSRAGLRAETVKRTARWLPEGMSFACEEAAEAADDRGQDADGASDQAEMSDDETTGDTLSSDSAGDEDLPAFLTTAAA